MQAKIKHYLSELEKDKNITILLACETGSRAWGFPSPDSDYDVRIIYKHHKNWYLNLLEQKDSIELFFDDNEIDISGWDLRKSLRLLLKSNPPLLERIQSPIIYQADNDFVAEINTIAQQTYSRIATIHHYLSMAKKALADITSTPEYKLKRFFYALRASVACVWILEREEVPPIEFCKMLEQLDLPNDLVSRISELIALKATKSESYFHSGELELVKFMQNSLARAENEAQQLPAGKGQLLTLNEFFIKTLGE